MSPLQTRRENERDTNREEINTIAANVSPIRKVETKRLIDGRTAVYDGITKTWRVS